MGKGEGFPGYQTQRHEASLCSQGLGKGGLDGGAWLCFPPPFWGRVLGWNPGSHACTLPSWQQWLCVFGEGLGISGDLSVGTQALPLSLLDGNCGNSNVSCSKAICLPELTCESSKCLEVACLLTKGTLLFIIINEGRAWEVSPAFWNAPAALRC